jgi:murein DD-endopeptidase MepM/ murein hydrolase activator NlpD
MVFNRKIFIFLLFLVVVFSLPHSSLYGATVDELKQKISEKEKNLGELEKEIKEYEEKLNITKKEATTLTEAIQQLDTTRKKLGTDISITENKIDSVSLNIERLGIEIGEKAADIDKNKTAIIATIQKLHEKERNSLIEVLFLHDSLSDFWSSLASLESLQKNITLEVLELKENKVILESKNEEAQVYRNDLSKLKGRLVGQKEVADIARTEKDKLLLETKNKQSNYEQLLAEKREAKKLFEQELAKFEAELREKVDAGTIPRARSGVLNWPLEQVLITQYFGNTPFATQNPGIYSGQGHNGIDLHAPIGTLVYSTRAGKVIGTGNTDIICPNSSYGNWILIEHDNGLSTLYAHLSLISVSSGQVVSGDTVIGYTGNTGYSTGPHLHLTVFATDGVKIGALKSRVCAGREYTIPLLSKAGAYLNPLSYLPEL